MAFFFSVFMHFVFYLASDASIFQDCPVEIIVDDYVH